MKPDCSDMDDMSILRSLDHTEAVIAAFLVYTMMPKWRALAVACRDSEGRPANPYEICNQVYLELKENQWSRLLQWQGHGSLAGWTAMVGSQIWYQYLQREHLSTSCKGIKASDYRLKLRGQSNDDLRMFAVDQVAEPRAHEVLKSWFVDKLSAKQMLEKYGDDAEEKLKKASLLLIALLIDSPSALNDIILVRKDPGWDPGRWHPMYENFPDDEEDNYEDRLTAFLAERYDSNDYDGNTTRFTDEISSRLNWSPLQKSLYTLHCIGGIPAPKVGEILNVPPTFVYNSCRKLARDFRREAQRILDCGL